VLILIEKYGNRRPARSLRWSGWPPS